LRLVMSSPGTEKPFVYLWQLIKHVGRKLTAEMNDGSTIEGNILFIDESNNTIRLETGSVKNRIVVTINFTDIKSSKIKLPF
jgi:ribosome maturation factor RimP